MLTAAGVFVIACALILGAIAVSYARTARASYRVGDRDWRGDVLVGGLNLLMGLTLGWAGLWMLSNEMGGQ